MPGQTPDPMFRTLAIPTSVRSHQSVNARRPDLRFVNIAIPAAPTIYSIEQSCATLHIAAQKPCRAGNNLARKSLEHEDVVDEFDRQSIVSWPPADQIRIN